MIEEILLILQDYTFQIVALGTGILGLMSALQARLRPYRKKVY